MSGCDLHQPIHDYHDSKTNEQRLDVVKDFEVDLKAFDSVCVEITLLKMAIEDRLSAMVPGYLGRVNSSFEALLQLLGTWDFNLFDVEPDLRRIISRYRSNSNLSPLVLKEYEARIKKGNPKYSEAVGRHLNGLSRN